MKTVTGPMSLGIRIVGSVVMLFFVLRSLNIREVANVLVRQVDLGFLCVAFLVFLIAQMMATWKWYVIGTRVFDVSATFFTYVRLFFSGIFYMVFLPGGQLVGEGMKAYRMVGASFPIHRVLASQFLDRVTGFIALGVLVLCAYRLDDAVYADQFSLFFLAGALTITCAGVGLLYMPNIAVRVFARHESFSEVMRAVRERRGILIASVVPGVLTHLLSAITIIFILWAFGIVAPFWLVVWMYLIMGIGIALPISYAGLGVREGAFVYYLASANISQEVAVSAALALFFVQLASACIGGLSELYMIWRK